MANEPEELRFKAVDEDGNLIECETLFMFESLDGRHFIVYTDNTVAETGETRVYASIYDPQDLKIDNAEDLATMNLTPITDEEDWAMIGEILQEMTEEDGGEFQESTSEEESHKIINVHMPEE